MRQLLLFLFYRWAPWREIEKWVSQALLAGKVLDYVFRPWPFLSWSALPVLELSVVRITCGIFSHENTLQIPLCSLCSYWDDQLVYVVCLCLLLPSFFLLMFHCKRRGRCVWNVCCSQGSVCVWRREEGDRCHRISSPVPMVGITEASCFSQGWLWLKPSWNIMLPYKLQKFLAQQTIHFPYSKLDLMNCPVTRQ